MHSSNLGIGYINEEVDIVHEWLWVQEPDLYHGGIKLVPEWDGAWGSVVVKALCYESDGPGINSQWCHWIFQWRISFWP